MQPRLFLWMYTSQTFVSKHNYDDFGKSFTSSSLGLKSSHGRLIYKKYFSSHTTTIIIAPALC